MYFWYKQLKVTHSSDKCFSHNIIWQIKKIIYCWCLLISPPSLSAAYTYVNILYIKVIGISHNCSFYSDNLDHQEQQKILLTNKNDFSENEDDTEVNNDGNDLPIFSECPISLNVSMFLCLLFMTCLRLTNVALEDLVLLLTANIPNYYKPKMSLYLLKKYF